jgi:centromere protein C
VWKTETESEIAVSSKGISTADPADGAWFIKLLCTPFFDVGAVDLPPGAIKRTKNTRKMHLAFFVLSGRVEVLVHHTLFRIAKGGMWHVLRGESFALI